jgi:hypothetical protein
MGKHSPRHWVRNVTTGLLAATVAATTFAVAQQGAGAINYDAGCSAVAVNAAGPTPVTVSYANPQFNPCVSQTKTLLTASATIIPAPLGIGATKATLSAVTSKTWEGFNYFGLYQVKASSDIAKLVISGPGLYVVATCIHSDVTVTQTDEGTYTTANAWIASLKVNGATINVLKNTPLVVPVGLRTALYVDYRFIDYNFGTATPLAVTFPDHRYYLTVAQSTAELGGFGECPNGC